MDGDMNNVIKKLNDLMSDKDTADSLKNILNNFSSSSNNSSQSSTSNTSEDKSSSSEFDINTILRIKNIMDNLNTPQNDSRSNLLNSLKPYLKESKKEKIDQYIKFLKIATVLESLNISGGDNNDV